MSDKQPKPEGQPQRARSSNATGELLRCAREDVARHRHYGDGVYLFRAFVEWSAATEQDRLARRKELSVAMDGERGLPTLEHQRASLELLAFSIIESLDPVMQDLLQACTSATEPSDALAVLRDALRIGRFHAPSDTKAKETKERCISAWIRMYLAVESGRSFTSENALAHQAGKECGISYKRALQLWRAFLTSEPMQQRWVADVITKDRNRKRSAEQRCRTTNAKPSKPKAWR